MSSGWRPGSWAEGERRGAPSDGCVASIELAVVPGPAAFGSGISASISLELDG
jgi:hypothetical protein